MSDKEKTEKPKLPHATSKDIVLGALESPFLRGVPCLLGPAGGGKTWLAQEIHKERHPDGVLVTIIPAQESGDELGGIPLRPTKAGQTVLWSLPIAIPKTLLERGGTIFVDELDKAAPDVWPVLLRLFAERTLRSTKLPDNVDIIAAANAPDIPLPDPLISRLFWLRYPDQADGAMQDADLDILPQSVVARIAAKQIAAVAETPYPPIGASRRAAHRLASWLRWNKLWESSDETRTRILLAILPQEMVPETLASLVKPKMTGMAEEWLAGASPSEVLAGLLDVVFSLESEELSSFYTALSKRADDDPTGEFGKVWDRATREDVFASINAPKAQKRLRELWAAEQKVG